MPDFRSDTVTQPTPAMREAMFKAPLGDDVFADDPSVNALQEHAAQLLGFEAALFAPSGTQTNLIALWGHCQRGDEAIVGQSWHTYRWEAGGMAVLGSIQPQPVETQSDGTLRVADIAAAIKPDDPHFARTRLVVLENTTGGQVLPSAYIAEVAQLARSRGLAMHLDGARMFNAATANAARNGTDVYDEARSLCSHFDSASLCLSKGLGAPVGSLVLGTRDFIRQARRTRKILGGGMRQAGGLRLRATTRWSTMCDAWRKTTQTWTGWRRAWAKPTAATRCSRAASRCCPGRPISCSRICMRMWPRRSPPGWHNTACASPAASMAVPRDCAG